MLKDDQIWMLPCLSPSFVPRGFLRCFSPSLCFPPGKSCPHSYLLPRCPSLPCTPQPRATFLLACCPNLPSSLTQKPHRCLLLLSGARSHHAGILAVCSHTLKQPLAILSLPVAFCDHGRPGWTTGSSDHHPSPVSLDTQGFPETKWMCKYTGLF